MEAASWDEGLSVEQSAAASHFGSHARLLAGHGTGKTYTLSRRVVYLVTERQVSPSEILVLTFTRMATRQLRSTIKRDLAPYSNEMPHISTLHSFSLRQLRRNSRLIDTLPQPLRIADDWEESNVIYEDMKELLNCTRTQVRQRFAQLSADWETLQADADDWRTNLPDAPFVGAWEEHRSVYGYTLRSELVYQLKKALDQIQAFELEPRFKHVLKDEYQDLNPCDLAIAKSIAAKGATVMACGDDDQSIYGFRFADPSGIRTFLDHYPDSADLQLTECRRCDVDILNAALWVAQQDTRRVAKAIRADDGRDGGEVRLLGFENGGNEARSVAALCRQLINEGISPGEMLILLRSDRHSALSRPIQERLEHLDVAVSVSTDKRSILDELHGRKLLSMLRLIADPRDHLAWRTRLEASGRLGPRTIEPIYAFARQEGIRFGDALYRLNEFEIKLPPGTRNATKTVIDQSLATIQRHMGPGAEADPNDPGAQSEGLKELVRQVAETEIPEEEGQLKALVFLNELIDSAGATNLDDLFTSIAINREDLEIDADETRVRLLTMHQAKGLSADVVFLISAEDEVLPRYESAKSIEEDRRLLYVSMTRARHKLFISYAERRIGQQRHTGRNSGNPQRHLTRYLRNSPLRVESGEDFVRVRVSNST